MLAIWSLVPLPFLKPAWTSGSSWFMYCWNLAWRILSITLLACEIVQLCGSLSILWHCLSLGLEWKLNFSNPVATAEFSKFSAYLSSVQSSCSVVSDSVRPHELQHARPPCTSPTPGVHSNSSPSSRWCHPAISYSVVPFSSCPQPLPASESFPMSQLFAWGGQITGVSALPSFLPKNTQGWSPLEWTGWLSLQSNGPSRVLSNTTVQKRQFLRTQLSSQSNSRIHTWPLGKP